MLLFKTKVGPSSIHGVGLFAEEAIPADTVLWQFSPFTATKLDPISFLAQADSLSVPALLEMVHYSYIHHGQIVSVHDNSRFINHSLSPNIESQGIDLSITLRKIKKGEEICEDYTESYDSADFFFWNLPEAPTKDQLLRIFEDRLLTMPQKTGS